MGGTADVVIVGAGPAGLSLACALADNGWSVVLVERVSRAELDAPLPDGREIALTHRSRGLLEQLGIWSEFLSDEIAPIRSARVVNGRSPFFLDFDTRGSGQEALGFLVANQVIRRACARAAARRPAIEVIDGHWVTGLRTTAGTALVELDDGRVLQARLAVAADSRFSESRRRMGIGADMTDFGRTVIVCPMAHELPHEAVARECFYYGNTLALLPLNGRRVSAVVTASSDQAAQMLRESDTDFAARIGAQFGPALGEFRVDGERHAYPLIAVYARRFVARRFALIGDAAVGMHPVTAHGFNFGLYGVDALTRAVTASVQTADPGDAAALARFESEHRRATLPIYLGTNALVRLFTDNRLPARALRSAVLRLAERLPPVKAGITRQLTGGPVRIGPLTLH